MRKEYFPNTTYVTDLDVWQFGDWIKTGIQLLKNNPDAPGLENESFILTRVNGEPLYVDEFETGVRTDADIISEVIETGKLGEGSSIMKVDGELKTRSFLARYSRKYVNSSLKFDVLIPEELDMNILNSRAASFTKGFYPFKFIYSVG